MKKALSAALYLLLFAVFSAPAQAHEIGNGAGGGYFSGLLHPVLGLDHFLAMECLPLA